MFQTEPQSQLRPSAALVWQTIVAQREVSSTFGLFDCAGDAPHLYREIEGSGLPHCTLFGGVVPRPLLEASPVCVHLGAKPHGGSYLLQRYWGNSACIVVTAAEEMVLDDVRKQLKRSLRVRLPTGARALFRYYDPRVLRAFLPTCTADQVRALMGKLTDMWCEGETPDLVLQWNAGDFHRTTPLAHDLTRLVPRERISGS